MKRLTSILAISVITVMTASAARADIASTTYAEARVNKVDSKTEITPTIQNSDEKYPSMATMYGVINSQTGSKVDVSQGDGKENKALITDADGDVVTGQIATGMIADNAVTAPKIATNAVTSDKIAANAVTTAKIGNLSVTNAKLAKEVTDSIADAKAAGTAATTALNQYKTTNDAAVKAAKDTADKAVVANAAITGATHTKITYDAKGLVTGGSNLGAADIPADLIKAGTNVTVARDTSTGVVTISSADTKYELPVATDTVRGGVIVDKALSADSTNPVQNKVVNTAIGTKITAPGTAEADITSDGTYTLTMKIVNGTKTYTWEKIGR